MDSGYGWIDSDSPILKDESLQSLVVLLEMDHEKYHESASSKAEKERAWHILSHYPSLVHVACSTGQSIATIRQRLRAIATNTNLKRQE